MCLVLSNVHSASLEEPEPKLGYVLLYDFLSEKPVSMFSGVLYLLPDTALSP